LDDHDLGERTLVGVHTATTPVLLVRQGGRLHAMDDRCSHRGCLLHEGKLEGNLLVCRCHGSTFHLDGSIVRGPATAPQPRYDVRARGGKIEIRAPAHDA
jgi:nitrite reductase/ring-hydroxylating ferredoxin subunit